MTARYEVRMPTVIENGGQDIAAIGGLNLMAFHEVRRSDGDERGVPRNPEPVAVKAAVRMDAPATLRTSGSQYWRTSIRQPPL